MLTEVAFCLSCYFSVLTIEYIPLILENRQLDKVPFFHNLSHNMHEVMAVFAATGAFLSFFHQGSLGGVAGVLFGKLRCLLSGGKVNPLIGAAGISAYPMAARVAQTEGRRYDKNNWLLMHAMGANTGGQIGSIMAAAVMLSVLSKLGVG